MVALENVMTNIFFWCRIKRGFPTITTQRGTWYCLMLLAAGPFSDCTYSLSSFGSWWPEKGAQAVKIYETLQRGVFMMSGLTESIIPWSKRWGGSNWRHLKAQICGTERIKLHRFSSDC